MHIPKILVILVHGVFNVGHSKMTAKKMFMKHTYELDAVGLEHQFKRQQAEQKKATEERLQREKALKEQQKEEERARLVSAEESWVRAQASKLEAKKQNLEKKNRLEKTRRARKMEEREEAPLERIRQRDAERCAREHATTLKLQAAVSKYAGILKGSFQTGNDARQIIQRYRKHHNLPRTWQQPLLMAYQKRLQLERENPDEYMPRLEFQKTDTKPEVSDFKGLCAKLPKPIPALPGFPGAALAGLRRFQTQNMLPHAMAPLFQGAALEGSRQRSSNLSRLMPPSPNAAFAAAYHSSLMYSSCMILLLGSLTSGGITLAARHFCCDVQVVWKESLLAS